MKIKRNDTKKDVILISKEELKYLLDGDVINTPSLEIKMEEPIKSEIEKEIINLIDMDEHDKWDEVVKKIVNDYIFPAYNVGIELGKAGAIKEFSDRDELFDKFMNNKSILYMG